MPGKASMRKPQGRPSLNREFHTLIHLVCESISLFRHYDPRRIAISLGPSRARGVHGTLAYVVPLRYVGGAEHRKGRRGWTSGLYTYKSEAIEREQPEARYLMAFLVPKFFRMSSFQRLETIVHELYHLHPTLRGDLRRFPKPHVFHGPTPAAFKRRVKELTGEALATSPFLEHHPLMTMDVDAMARYERFRYPMPTHRFVPDRGPLGALKESVSRFFLWATFLLSATQVFAALPVRIKTPTILQGRPVPGSEVVFQAEPGMRFQATKQSADKKWVYLESSLARGWAPKERVILMSGSGKSRPQNSESFGDIGEAGPGTDLDSFDLLQSSAVAGSAMELYSEPATTAERFSQVERGDELQILNHAKGRTWYQVRLMVTGEEGWLPASAVQVEDFDRVSRAPNSVLQANFLLGTDRLGYGAGLGYFYNAYETGMSGRPRDRLEFGLEANYFMKSFSVGGFSVNRSSFLWSPMIRYLPSVSNGRFYGIAEIGLAYIYSVYSSALSEDDLISEDAKEKPHMFGVAFGGGVGVNLNETFGIQALARMYLKSNLLITGGLGVYWRF